jgi:gas vesicle protein
MRRLFSFFVGVITGGLVGAAIAILVAPVSGLKISASGTIHPLEG